MGVLLEGISIIVRNDALESRYPGGVEGLRADCPNGSFCTDGTLSRAAFMDERDAACFIGLLLAHGLELGEQGAADIAVFAHGGRLRQPCLWLEMEVNRDGLPICWLAGTKPGRIFVPDYFDLSDCAGRHYRLSATEWARRFERIGSKDRVDFYRDRRTGKVIPMGGAILRH